MRWIKFCSAVLAAMSMASLADAGSCCSLNGACDRRKAAAVHRHASRHVVNP